MAELRIHQERLDEDSIRQLIDICPFGAISCRDGKVELWLQNVQAVCEERSWRGRGIYGNTGTGD